MPKLLPFLPVKVSVQHLVTVEARIPHLRLLRSLLAVMVEVTEVEMVVEMEEGMEEEMAVETEVVQPPSPSTLPRLQPLTAPRQSVSLTVATALPAVYQVSRFPMPAYLAKLTE